jgi:hypothetical protein
MLAMTAHMSRPAVGTNALPMENPVTTANRPTTAAIAHNNPRRPRHAAQLAMSAASAGRETMASACTTEGCRPPLIIGVVVIQPAATKHHAAAAIERPNVSRLGFPRVAPFLASKRQISAAASHHRTHRCRLQISVNSQSLLTRIGWPPRAIPRRSRTRQHQERGWRIPSRCARRDQTPS